jgi:hypothetical protein
VSIEADTVNQDKLIQFQYELEGVVSNPTLLSSSATAKWNGRTNHTFSFEPFRAQQLRFISTDGVIGRLYDWKWWVSPEPPIMTNWNSNWEDGGYLGAKFVQRLIIDADTLGVTKIMDLENENGIFYQLSVNHTKRQGIAYAIPFATVCTKFRAIPRDPNPSWLYGIKWVWKPHPESVWSHQTQFTSLGFQGWWHMRDGYIAYESNSVVYLTLERDDHTKYAIQLPNTNNVYRKVYVVFSPLKQKLLSYKLATFLDDPTIPITWVATLD